MPFLVFDPEGEFDTCAMPESKFLSGGGLTPEKRCEYLGLCSQMTSRDPSLNYTELRDQILAIMRADVVSHIETLPEGDRPALLASIEQFYSTIDSSDNPLTCINVIALQTTILFTIYLEDPADKNKYHFTSYTAYVYYTQDDSWKTYSGMKELISSEETKEFEFLLSNSDPSKGIPPSETIFLAFLGFLTLRELMETILNNVFFCGLTYELHYVDGPFGNPMVSLWHDKFHYENFEGCFEYPTLLKEFRDFQKFVVRTQEKSAQYAVNFVLFCLLHEEPYCNRFEELGNSLNSPFFKDITTEHILEQLDLNLENLLSLENQGKAIPKAYRELKKGSTSELKEKKVKHYLELASQLYVNCYKEYERSKNTTGGKRFTRKKQKKQKKGKSRRTLH